ncbi:MAG: DUF4234 domain-containing protein [Thermodesulfobacteriota bacterium]
MRCPRCKGNNDDAARYCSLCGNELPHGAHGARGERAASEGGEGGDGGIAALGEMAVVQLVFFSLFTFGIYSAVWFLKRLEAINNLRSEVKIGEEPFGFIIAGSIVNIGLVLFVAASGEPAESLSTENILMASDLLGIAVQVTMIVQCFKLRSALVDHTGGELHISWVWTILFTVFYLQHKINRLMEQSGNESERIYHP